MLFAAQERFRYSHHPIGGVWGADPKGAEMEKRILVVDDEVGILLALKTLLREPNLEVDTAQTIEEAETLLDTKSYAAVICDLRLTGILGEEGLEIISYVRERGMDTRIVLITGYGTEEIQRRAMELGADRYFKKPVASETLREALIGLGVSG